MKKWTGCDIETEFFGDERKHSKEERKRKQYNPTTNETEKQTPRLS